MSESSRAMPIRGLHHVNLRGSPEKIREMKRFYCNVLGLIDGPRPPFSSTGAWLYAGGSPLVHLVEDTNAGHAGGTSRPTVDHLAFACRGLDELRRRLDRQGVGYTITHVPMTGEVQVNLFDPSGLKVELAFSPDDQARWNEGEPDEFGEPG